MTYARFRPAALVLGAALALSMCAADAPAEETRGKQAHRYRASAVFNMPYTKNPLRRFSGRVVLLIVFNVWGEKSVEPVERMNKWHDEYGPDGMTILGVTEAEVDAVKVWNEKHGVKFALSVVETAQHEEIKRRYAIPGHPWGFLIDPHGKVVWEGHPMMLKKPHVKPLLKDTRRPPRLPAAFKEAQAVFDDGRWTEGAKMLVAQADAGGLSKVDERWARRTSEWVTRRSKAVLEECETDVKEGRDWDAWDTFRDYKRRFAGLESVAHAEKRMAEIRADPEAAADLEAGDYIAKTRELIEKKKWRKARLRVERAKKKYKDTRHAARAADLETQLPGK